MKQKLLLSKIRYVIKLIFVGAFLLLSFNSVAQTQTFTTSGTFTVPAGVTQVTVECWGGGGGGGNTSHSGNGTSRGGGGAGGAYAKKVIGITPGNYTVTVGSGGTGSNAGNDSWFVSTTTVIAKGGASGNVGSKSDGLGGLGTSSGSIGDIVYSGGNGGNASSSGSGGGGGGAGSSGIGKNASGNTAGGSTSANGGGGGDGITNSSGYYNGVQGSVYGSGGSGSISIGNPGTARTGGSGSNGLVIISWTVCSAPTSYAVFGGGSYCSGGTGVEIGLSGSEIGVTYQLYRGASTVGSPVSGSGSSISFGNQTTAGTYTVEATRSIDGCGATMTGNAVVTIITPPSISTTSPGSRCGTGTVVLSASASSGTLNWYDAASGGNYMGTGSPFTTPVISSTTTYYVDATDGSCTTATRTPVIASIFPEPSISAGGGGSFCAGTNVTLTSSGTNITNQYWTGPNSFYSLDQNPVLSSVTPAMSGTYIVTGSSLSGANLVTNGDFASGNTGFTTEYTLAAQTSSGLNPEGAYDVVALPSSRHTNFCSCGDHTTGGGYQMVINGAPLERTIWSQTVNIVPNTYYQFTYWVQTVVNGDDANPSKLQLFVNGGAAGPIYTANPATGVWTQFTYNWTSGPLDNSATLSLKNENFIASGNDFALDDIVFQQACQTTDEVDIQVDPVSVGGSVAGGGTICSGSSSGLLTLSGHTGTITKWQSSVDNWVTPVDIANTSTTYTSGALTQTTQFRAVVTNGACSSANSAETTATIIASPLAPTANNQSKNYDGIANSTAITATPGAGETIDWYDQVSGGSLLVAGNTSYTPVAVNAGTYTFYAEARNTTTGCSSNPRTAVALTINKATPTVTPTVGTYTYNGLPQGPNAATNTGTGTSYTFSYSGVSGTTYGPSATLPVDAGTYEVVAAVAADANYNEATSSALPFTIDKAALTISATDQSKCFGTVFNFTGAEFTSLGLINSDEVTTVTLTSSGSLGAAAAGSYSIVPSAAIGSGIDNYTITYVDGTMVVDPNVTSGTISGSSPLCIGATSNYTTDGTSGGSWSSTDAGFATVDPSTGLVTAVGSGTTDIIYTVNSGCGSPVSTSFTLTVDPNASIASVTGSGDLCVGATGSYTANGLVTSGGTGAWSSSNTLVATVDAVGLVTGVSAGTCNIIYTITDGCGGTVSAFQPLTITGSGSWLGTTSTDWHTDSNWCGGVPTAATNVIIPAGGNQPEISADAVCNNLTVNAGATLTIVGSNTLTVNGNWSNSGTFIGNTSTVIYGGSGAQTIAAVGYHNLSTSGSGIKTLSGATTVGGELAVIAGTNLNLSSFSLNSPTSVILECGSTGSVISGTGTLTLGGNVAVNVPVSPGASGAVISCPVVLGATRTFTVADGTAASDLAISGIISGITFGLTKDGPGTLLLSRANTYTGGTIVNGGTLKAGIITSAFGVTSSVTLANSAGVTLDITGFNNTIGSLTGGGANGGNVILGAATLTMGSNNTSPAAYDGIISGTGALIKSGTGILTLSGANSYTGATTISAGTLSINNIQDVSGGNSSIGAPITIANGTINIGATGILKYTGSGHSSNRVINGTADGGAIDASGAGTLTLTGGRTGANNNLVLTGTGNGIESGIIGSGNATVTKSGIGTWTLSGANSYTGITTISAGTLKLGGSGSGANSPLGTTLGATTITSGAVLDLNGFTLATAESLTIRGAGLTALPAGALTNTGNDASYTGAITLAAAATITTTNSGSLTLLGAVPGNFALTLNGTGLGTISGVRSGTSTIIKSGTGIWTLSGANTYTGATTISAGTLSINSIQDVSGGNSSIGAPITIANGTINIGATGILKYTGSGHSSNRVINGTADGGTIDASGTGTLILTGGRTGANNNLVLTGTGDAIESGIIGSGNATLTKNGTGTWTLSGANTYTGATTVSDGVLNIQNAAALGTTTTGTTVSNGAALQLQGGITVGNEALTLNGTGISSDGVLRNISGNNTWGGAITLSGNSEISSDSETLRLNGNISGNFQLILDGNGLGIVAGVRSGSGSLIKDGTGTWTLSGINTFTGSTTINSGTLQYGIANSLAISPVVLNGGTLSTGASTGFSDVVGALTLTGNSTIALGTGNHTLRFATSSAVSWTSGAMLTITGWQGVDDGSPGTDGQVFVGPNASGLTPAQVGQIQFFYGGNYLPAIILSTGEVVPFQSPTITTGSISGSPFCAGEPVSVPFSKLGTFISGNVFTAQLSDATGSFGSPLDIGSLISTSDGTISATIPSNTGLGSSYRIRVVSSNPVVTGTDNGSDMVINPLPATGEITND